VRQSQFLVPAIGPEAAKEIEQLGRGVRHLILCREFIQTHLSLKQERPSFCAGIELKQEVLMRSDKVFEALHTVQNRYMLCQLASKATRKFHRPNTRIQETTNEIFLKIAGAEKNDDVMAIPATASEAQRRAA
jgi:hypothetical protein